MESERGSHARNEPGTTGGETARPIAGPTDLDARRAALRAAPLDPTTAPVDPVRALLEWWDDADRAGVALREAATLATVDEAGDPDARTVLVRGLDDRGVAFYTNRESPKAQQLARRPRAALVLHWRELERQVRVRGAVEDVPDDEADRYWASRPRGHRISAWASPQSRRLADRRELDASITEAEARFAGEEPERPRFWGGYRLVPDEVELWQGRADRRHDRVRWTETRGGWRVERLAP